MSLAGYFLSGTGLALMAGLIIRFFAAALYRKYPLIFAYVLYAFLRTLAMLYFQAIAHPSYPFLYWYSNVFAQLLWFGVAWDIHRNVLPAGSAVRRAASAVLIVLLLSLAAGFYITSDDSLSWLVEIERKIGFTVSVWLILILLVASSYGLRMGRNLWGVTIGAGIYLAIAIMNFAALDLLDSFFLFARIVRPVSFLFLLGVWLWALWSYAPSPQVRTQSEDLFGAVQNWRSAWNGIGLTIRKVLRS